MATLRDDISPEAAARIETVVAPQGNRWLQNRRVPNTSGRIPHIIVNDAGIWVVNVRPAMGWVEVEKFPTTRRRRHMDRLVLDGQDRTEIVSDVIWQIEMVKTAIGSIYMDVNAILCFDGADLMDERYLDVEGIIVCTFDDAIAKLGEPGRIPTRVVENAYSRLDSVLSPD